MFEEQLQGGVVTARLHVFTEGQHQVVVQAHGGRVVHRIATRHRDEVGVSAEVNRAVGGAQACGHIAIDVHHGLMDHRLCIGVGLQDHLIAGVVAQSFFGIDGDVFVVQRQNACAIDPSTCTAVGCRAPVLACDGVAAVGLSHGGADIKTLHHFGVVQGVVACSDIGQRVEGVAFDLQQDKATITQFQGFR